MANYTITAEELNENSMIFVRGKLGYSRTASLIEGPDLVAVNARRSQNNMNPINDPHVTVTLHHAEVVPGDPANPTKEEAFVSERRYNSNKHPETGLNYSIDSKGRNLPTVAVLNSSQQYDQDTSGQELARGLDVILVLRVYKPKNYNKRGLALDTILVQEPVRHYVPAGGANVGELAQRGIVFSAPPQQVQPAQTPTASEEAPAVPAGSQVVDGFVLPGPGDPTPAPAQQAAPAQAAPAPTAVPAVTAHPQAPATETDEQRIARLQAELAAAQAGSSAVGQADGPWDAATAAGISYPG